MNPIRPICKFLGILLETAGILGCGWVVLHVVGEECQGQHFTELGCVGFSGVVASIVGGRLARG